MYKSTSRNQQRRIDSAPGKRPLTRGQKEQRQRQRVEALIAADLARIKDADHLPKLGGWPLDRFATVGAKLSYWCQKCSHRTKPESALAFATDRARASLATPLLKARKAMACEKCGGGYPAVGIHAEGHATWFGGQRPGSMPR